MLLENKCAYFSYDLFVFTFAYHHKNSFSATYEALHEDSSTGKSHPPTADITHSKHASFNQLTAVTQQENKVITESNK